MIGHFRYTGPVYQTVDILRGTANKPVYYYQYKLVILRFSRELRYETSCQYLLRLETRKQLTY